MVVSVKELEGAIEIDNTESLETNMSNRNLPVSKRNEIEKHLPVATWNKFLERSNKKEMFYYI